MAYGTTLRDLLLRLRAECGHALEENLGRATERQYQMILERVQDWLYHDFDWPQLMIRRDIEIAAGQRYYDFPADINFDRITRVDVKFGGVWERVEQGITLQDYTDFDPEQDVRSDPVLKWDYHRSDSDDFITQMEVWPVPGSDFVDETGEFKLKVEGVRVLKRLTLATDRAMLDDMLIVLFAAAEILADQNAPSAQAKLAAAQQHYSRLKGSISHQAAPAFSWLGSGIDKPDRRQRITVVQQR